MKSESPDANFDNSKNNSASSVRKKIAVYLPLLVAVIALTITFCIWYALGGYERQTISGVVKTNAASLRSNIETQVNNHVHALERMASRWAMRGGTPREEWTGDATKYVTDFNGYQAVEWVDQTGHIRWVMPEKGNEKAINFDLTSEINRRTALEKARDSRTTALSRSVDLVQGGKGFLVFAPIHTGDNFGGFITGIFRVKNFIELSLPDHTLENYSLELFDGDQKIYESAADKSGSEFTAQETVEVCGVNWVMRVTPGQQTVSSLSSSANEWALIIGIILSALLAWIVWLAQQARRRAFEAAKANSGLENEIRERKRIQKALQETSTLQKAVLNGANYMIIAADPEGTIISFNKAAEKNLGYAAEDIVGKASPAIFHDPTEIAARAEELSEETGETIEPGFEVFVRKSRSNEVDEREWTYIRKDGSRFPITLSITALRDEAGQIKGFLGIGSDITEKKRVMEKVRAAEERFKTFMNNSPAVSYLKDSDGKYVFMNKTMERMFKTSVTDSENVTDSSLMSEELAKITRERDEKVIQTGEILEYTQTIPSADGVTRIWQSYKFPVYDVSEKPFVGVVAFDITKQQESEYALRKSEEYNRALIEKSPGFICTHSLDGTLTMVNPSAARSLGYKPEEMVGKSLKEFIDPEMRNFFGNYLETIYKEKDFSGLMHIVSKNGDARIWSFNNTLYEEDGVSYVMGHAFDTTESKQAEYALRKSEERMRLFVENTPAAVAMLDCDMRYVMASERWLTDYNLGDQDITGRSHYEIFPDLPQGRKEIHRRGLAGEIVKRDEESFENEDGTMGWLRWEMHPWHNDQGNIGGIIFFTEVITLRKQMEEQLREARDAALESARMKSEFLANMSHEIRTPMNGVIGMTDILLTTQLSSDQREHAEIIKNSADGLLNIINDILDFSKIEAGKLNFETIEFDLRHTVESTVELFADQARRKKIEIASLVESDVATALCGDPGRLRQVLTNLIGNAIKFTARGEVIIRVYRENETGDDCVLRFDVTDSGIGIKPEQQKYLFQAFTQADGSMTRKFGGTGLGLAISKQLVEMMNGEISVQSEMWKGSVFSFTARFEKQETENAMKAIPRRSLENLRVLVVDDNATNRKILMHQVASRGMFAEEAEDGAAALEILKQAADRGNHFDLALLDLMMPEMSGFELSYLIKSDVKISDIKLILMPSFGQRGHAATARQNGIDCYLIKPVRQSDLFDCIAALTADIIDESKKEAKEKLSSPLITHHYLEENRRGNQKLILLAEDNIVNQKVAKLQLEKLGYQTRIVSNGLEALQAFDKQNYSAILMDCQMPEMDGYTATTMIRQAESGERHIPIIAMTANAMQGEREKCLAAGMDDYISKPVKADILAEVLQQQIENYSGLKPLPVAPADVEIDLSEINKLDSLDMSVLDNFRELQMPDSSDLVTDLIDLFLEDTEKRLIILKQAVAKRDTKTIKEQAHTFKGSAGNIGAKRMAALGKQIEENVFDIGLLKRLTGEIEIEFKAVSRLLKNMRVN